MRGPFYTPTPLLAFSTLHHLSPSVSSRFHFIPVQRISVKQAHSSAPASISTILCFPIVLFWVPFFGTLAPPPPSTPTPSSHVISCWCRPFVICGKNKLKKLLFYLPPTSKLSIPPLLNLSVLLNFSFFDKRNSGGFWQILESGWSSCIFWEWLSRASCKEDVAEERCFLTDKGKASLRQDVWAWLGPALKSQSEGREPAVQQREETVPCWLASYLPVFTYPLFFGESLCQPGLLYLDHKYKDTSHKHTQ